MKPHAISVDGKYAVVDDTQWDYIKDKIGRNRGQQRCLCGGDEPERRALGDVQSVQPRDSLLACRYGHISYALVPYVPRHWDVPVLTPSSPDTPVAKKTIADWPIACPKCKRPDSAVLLFAGYDCRHGCYK